MYSLICRHSNVNALPSQQTEVMELSAYKLELPNKHQRRAEKIRDALERSSFAKGALLSLALLGTCMVIGDGILTPCISGYLFKLLLQAPCSGSLLFYCDVELAHKRGWRFSFYKNFTEVS